ncbi:MAG TPA: hypothetical protein DCM62_04120, partial [Bacteroidales bacterium]|nr:hypothetical protein [Bacteroidales bacterium]
KPATQASADGQRWFAVMQCSKITKLIFGTQFIVLKSRLSKGLHPIAAFDGCLRAKYLFTL